jgi:hypothetical protein
MRFVVGALGIVAGFFVYQFGLFLMLNLSSSLTDLIVTYVPWIEPADILGAALQLAGGVIAIAGLLVSISWIGTQSRAAALPSKPRGATEPVKQLESGRRCKFCGAVMEPDAAFCPSCQRAQA